MIFCLIKSLLFAILFGNLCQFCLAERALATDILELAECYKKFKYGQKVNAEENKQLGMEMHAKNVQQMKGIMGRHFGIIPFFEGCLKGLQKNNSAFEEIKRKIFKKSKMSEWMKMMEKMLEKEYKEIGDNFVDKEGNERNKTFKWWRRILIPHGDLVEAFYFGFAKNLLEKVMAKFPPSDDKNHNQKLVANLKWIAKRMGEEAETNQTIAALSFLRDFTAREFLKEKSFFDFAKIYKEMEKLIRNLEIEWNLDGEELRKNNKFNLPKVKRVIWIFRHAHRHDNALAEEEEAKKKEKENKRKWAKLMDQEWEEKVEEKNEEKKEGDELGMSTDLVDPFKVYDRTFGKDNSPLSMKGKEMAARLEPILGAIPVKHIYASPFERTVDTAGLLLGKSHPGLKIRLEPGLLESMHKSKGEPTFVDCEALKAAGHGRLDCDYKPKYGKGELMESAKLVEKGDRDDACVVRAEEILMRIVRDEMDGEGTSASENEGQSPIVTSQDGEVEKEEERSGRGLWKWKGTGMEKEEKGEKKNWGDRGEWIAPGEENAEHIVLVTHATVVLAIEQYFDGKYKYVPQLSITKLVELDGDERGKMENQNPLKNFRMVYGSESKHLADEGGQQEMHLYKW